MSQNSVLFKVTFWSKVKKVHFCTRTDKARLKLSHEVAPPDNTSSKAERNNINVSVSSNYSAFIFFLSVILRAERTHEKQSQKHHLGSVNSKTVEHP